MAVQIGGPLTFDNVVDVAYGRATVETTRDVAERVGRARALVEEVAEAGRTVYGITTGIGDLANVRIPPAEAKKLQRDIVRSHATAVGPSLPREVVRAMLLLRARTFAFGHSGVRLEIIERLVHMINNGWHPVVPAQGSLGASGDLALLAHLALPIMGEGHVEVDGEVRPSADVLREAGLEPIELSYKEGLALVNGTEAMLALGILTYTRAMTLAKAADVTGAMSVEALLGTDRAFDEALVALRQHAGPTVVAANLRGLMANSEIVASHRTSEHLVQDAYSLRCIPQVHGAYRDGLVYVRGMLEAELGSAIDNPSVMPDAGEVMSGGNFHGEALGLALDHLTLCLTGFATIAERRVARLIDPHLSNGLPAFLTQDAGRRSGFMLMQYTAASLVSENRSLCFPASADTIPTSAGQEDHVSMGATSARKAAQVLENVENVIAIEAMSAAQGLDLRTPLKPAPATSAARDAVRELSPYLEEDRSMAREIPLVKAAIAGGRLLDAVGSVLPVG